MLSIFTLKNFPAIGFLIISTILLNYACSDKQASADGYKLPPTPVEIAKVKTQDVADKFEAVGTIEAIEGVTIVSEIDASVISLPFEEGSFIKKGDLIAQLDDSQLSAEVNRTEALYNQSKASYKRVKSIVDQNAGTPQDLDDAVANLKVAEANFELAKARLSKTRIVAPFDGIIGTRKVSAGAFLRTGQEITELANLNEIRISFSAPERFLAQLKRNADVIVSSSVFPGYEVKGKIMAIEPILDAQTRNVNVVARVKNPGQKFRPGMSANISAVLSERPNALTVPNEAVFANGNQSFVFVVNKDSSVITTPVTLGLQTAKIVEVVDGLQDGMQVVKAGHQKLFDGAKVMPVNSQEETAVGKTE
ncbi:MAG: efflux RND transporter periplasmic adaptor subunit [Ignavibacteriaceae bacterium]